MAGKRKRQHGNSEIYKGERERLERNKISRDRKKERINWSGRWKERSRNKRENVTRK